MIVLCASAASGRMMRMNEVVKVFEHETYGKIRTTMSDGEPWFVLSDLCKALNLSSPHKVAERLDDDQKGRNQIPTLGGVQTLVTINESGLYEVIIRSDKPEAKKFRRWITTDVLPTIRKHGFYASDDVLEQFLNDPDMAIGAFTKLKEARDKVKELEAANHELVQKCSYLDIITACKDAIPITVIAHDYGMSAVDMNRELKHLGIQYRMKCGTWILYQKYKDEGYTKSVTFVYDKANGKSSIHTYWTQKGRLFIYEKLKEKGILPVCERSEENDRQ